jgi:hypothetical protein
MIKRIIAIGTIAAIVGLSGGFSLAEEADVYHVTAPDVTGSTLPTTFINDLEIPHEILEYVQLKHQGYAVTHATQLTRNGLRFYELRVDRGTGYNSHESIYMYFDADWKEIQVTELPIAPAPELISPSPSTEAPSTETESLDMQTPPQEITEDYSVQPSIEVEVDTNTPSAEEEALSGRNE